MCAVADWYCFIYLFFCLPQTRFDSLIAVVSRALFMDLYNQSKNMTVFVTKLCTANWLEVDYILLQNTVGN